MLSQHPIDSIDFFSSYKYITSSITILLESVIDKFYVITKIKTIIRLKSLINTQNCIFDLD